MWVAAHSGVRSRKTFLLFNRLLQWIERTHTYVCACVCEHMCEHTDLALRLADHCVGGQGWIPLSLNMGRKVDFVFSPIKVKFWLETIALVQAWEIQGLLVPPSLSSTDFMWRTGMGEGVGVAVEAAHWPGCQSIRVISTTLVKGSAAIYTIFLTHELGRGFRESCPVSQCFRKATEPPRT